MALGLHGTPDRVALESHSNKMGEVELVLGLHQGLQGACSLALSGQRR